MVEALLSASTDAKRLRHRRPSFDNRCRLKTIDEEDPPGASE
jgi:hypothetical protein